jgi:polysaccharide pyruvyl transferase WcaK-like protein
MMGHGGAQNRGCEALARSTAAMIPDTAVTLGSTTPEEDRNVFIGGNIDTVIRNGPAAKPSPLWALGAVSRRLLKTDLSLPLVMTEQKRAVRECSLFVSIGGDNYCYGKPYWLMALNKAARQGNVPVVLWGASVDPGSLEDKDIRDDLTSLSAVTARESITYYALKETGAPVTLAPDPAFTLPAEPVPLPEGFRIGETVGINVSPLVTRYEGTPGVTLAAFRSLIDHILTETSCSVALIPHVVGEGDPRILAELAKNCPPERVFMVDPANGARELKYIISQCRVLVAARTHASIAAYSSGVPALVLGYSVKARGIARDLFGSENGLMLPVKELTSAGTLIETFRGFMRREDELRKHLERVLPDFIGRAKEAGEILRRYVGSREPVKVG